MKKVQVSKQGKSIKPGSLWQLGQHRLAFGDSRDKQLLKKLFNGQKINLICTDPPYGVAAVESKRDFNKLSKDKAVAGDHIQSEAEYLTFSKEWLEALSSYLAPANVCYIFNADKMVWPLREGMKHAGFKTAQLLIWVKSQAVVGRLDYAPQHELIMYGWYGRHRFRRSKDKSVIFYPKPIKSKFHPTTKPIGLITRLILNSSSIGDVVFDGFLGSGTTLLSCERTKRRCFAVELDLEYCITAIARWEKLTGQKARLL